MVIIIWLQFVLRGHPDNQYFKMDQYIYVYMEMDNMICILSEGLTSKQVARWTVMGRIMCSPVYS